MADRILGYDSSPADPARPFGVVKVTGYALVVAGVLAVVVGLVLGLHLLAVGGVAAGVAGYACRVATSVSISVQRMKASRKWREQ